MPRGRTWRRCRLRPRPDLPLGPGAPPTAGLPWGGACLPPPYGGAEGVWPPPGPDALPPGPAKPLPPAPPSPGSDSSGERSPSAAMASRAQPATSSRRRYRVLTAPACLPAPAHSRDRLTPPLRAAIRGGKLVPGLRGSAAAPLDGGAARNGHVTVAAESVNTTRDWKLCELLEVQPSCYLRPSGRLPRTCDVLRLSRVSRGMPTYWPEFSAPNVRPGWVSRPAVGLGDRPILGEHGEPPGAWPGPRVQVQLRGDW